MKGKNEMTGFRLSLDHRAGLFRDEARDVSGRAGETRKQRVCYDSESNIL